MEQIKQWKEYFIKLVKSFRLRSFKRYEITAAGTVCLLIFLLGSSIPVSKDFKNNGLPISIPESMRLSEAIAVPTKNTAAQIVQAAEEAAPEPAVQSEPKNIKTYADGTKKLKLFDSSTGYFWVPYNDKLPLHNYDWSNLKEKDGCKYYVENGNITSYMGIDVSKYQEDINWKAVRNCGIDYAFIRVGYRGYDHGTLKEDSKAKKNMKEASAAGIKVGVYFYSQAVNDAEAQEEADFVLNMIQGYQISYPVVYDTEHVKGGGRHDQISKEQRTSCAVAFCEKIKAAGYRPMIYANTTWLTQKLNLEKLTSYDVWYAAYDDNVLYPYWFQVWQYTSRGKVEGITGNVDINISFFDYS